MRKYSFSKEEKLEIRNPKSYPESLFSLNEVADLYKVHRDTIKGWQNNYLFFWRRRTRRFVNHNNYSKK